MITRDQAYDIIVNINENAHQQAWDTWLEADELMESEVEEDWETAEEIREQASQEQAEYFREEFNNLDDATRDAVLEYVFTDEEFKEEFSMWYGEDDFVADFD